MFSNLRHKVLAWLPFTFVVGISLLLYSVCFTPGEQFEYTPLHLEDITIEPGALQHGDTAIFTNGICNSSDRPLTVQVFIGAQSTEGDPLFRIVYPVVGQADTETGRERVTIEPGCYFNDPIYYEVPDAIPPGEYQLVVHVVTRENADNEQSITDLSNPFIVRSE